MLSDATPSVVLHPVYASRCSRRVADRQSVSYGCKITGSSRRRRKRKIQCCALVSTFRGRFLNSERHGSACTHDVWRSERETVSPNMTIRLKPKWVKRRHPATGLGLLYPPRADIGDGGCRLWAACVDGSGLARRRIFTSQPLSEQPCVRPLNAVLMTAGLNAVRGSGPGQKHAFEDAVAQVGCLDRRIDRHCITCCSPSQPLRHAGGVRRDVVTPRARRVHCSVRPSPSSPRPSWRACWRARWRRPWPVAAPAAP
jgi:hypothetical protein